MKNQLIIFYGASPGAGKSTLSSFLFKQLSLHNIPVRWVYEEDILHLNSFATVIHNFQKGKQEQILPSLLEATAAFVQDCLSSEAIAITDSIFPCFNWLIATDYYSTAQIENFSEALEKIISPLKPLLIYLDVDSETGLKRAIQQRGQQWYKDLQIRVNQYEVNRTKDVHTLRDVATYFDRINQHNLSLLSKWSREKLIFNVAQTPIEQLKLQTLHQFDLSEKRMRPIIAQSSLSNYIGIYRSKDENVPAANPLNVELIDGHLTINTYWPKGCQLIEEGPGQFRLEDTSHRLKFDTESNRMSRWLTYDNTGKVYRYEKVW